MRTLGEITENYTILDKEYKETADVVFEQESKALFSKYPRLKSFGFTAYTPHFNDGEPCRYHAYTDEPYINGKRYWSDPDEESLEGEDLYHLSKDEEWNARTKSWDNKAEYDKEAKEICAKVANFLTQFKHSYLESRFGDSVKVTISAEKIKTEYYEHD